MSSQDKKRLFVAIELPEYLKSKIYKQSQKFFLHHKRIKQVPLKNIHITLKFLGNVEESKIPQISLAIEESLKGAEAFDISLMECLGAFPSPRKAGVIFVGVKEGSIYIQDIFNRLEHNLDRVGFKAENRKFVPHATIARVKGKMDLTSVVKNLIFDQFTPFKCDKILLIESILKPEGAQYIIRKEYDLKDF